MKVQNINQNNYQNSNVGFKAHVHGVWNITCMRRKLQPVCKELAMDLFRDKAIKSGKIRAEHCGIPFIVAREDGYHILLPDTSKDSFRKIIDLNPFNAADNETALQRIDTGVITAAELTVPKIGGETECPMLGYVGLGRGVNIRGLDLSQFFRH